MCCMHLYLCVTNMWSMYTDVTLMLHSPRLVLPSYVCGSLPQQKTFTPTIPNRRVKKEAVRLVQPEVCVEGGMSCRVC